MGCKGRDVEVVALDNGNYLVAACDSCGAVGSKELDEVKVPNYIVGRLTSRVALLEVLSVGAAPQVMTVNLCCEPTPTGEEILKGVREELASLDLRSLPIAISTEKNIPTRQTGAGISVFGSCNTKELRIATTEPGDMVYCLGVPKVGNEVGSPDDPQIIKGEYVRNLLSTSGIHDILPVGSKGIRREAELLAESIGAEFQLETGSEVDINKPAGPSTCALFTCRAGVSLPHFSLTPIYKIGKIVNSGKQ